MKYLKPFFDTKLIVFVLLSILILAGQAYALNISPGDELYNGTGTSNNQNVINNFLELTFEPDLIERYKYDVGVGESGSLQGSYDTSFANTANDPSDALIEYVGGPFIIDAYLLVKDGAHDPYWYLFDLTSEGLGWNGTENLVLTGFWPDQGAISHVSLYSHVSPVPEPATLLLLGTGLIGFAGFSRKKLNKKISR